MSLYRLARLEFKLSPILATLCSGVLIVCLGAAAFGQFAKPSVALVVGALIVCGLVSAIRAIREADLHAASLTLFIAYAAAVLLWAWHYDSKQWGDIGVYYRCGTTDLHAAHTVRDWMGRCQGKAIGETSAFWTRALLYTAPFGAVFGDNYSILKLANALAHIATVFLLYRTVQAFSSTRTALIATALFALYPEWWFTTTVAMPDNLSMLGLVFFFHAVTQACRSTRASLGWGAAAILSFVVVDLQRTCGMLMVAGLLLAALMSARPERRRLFGLLISLLCATVASGHLIEMFRLTPVTNQSTSVFGVLSGLDFTGDSASMREYGWNQFFVGQIPAAHRLHEVFARMAEAFSSGFSSLIRYWFDKLRYLLQGNGYLNLANTYGQYLLDDIPVPVHHMITNRVAVSELARGYGVGVTLLALAGLILRPVQALPEKLALTFSAAFLLMMVGLWEIQPRYVLLITPALCLFAANGFSAKPLCTQRPSLYRLRLGTAVGSFALVFIVAVTCVRFAAQTYANRLPHILKVTQQPMYSGPDGKLCNAHPLPVEVKPHDSRIMLPRHGEGCYSFEVDIAHLGHEASLFIARANTPTLWEMTYDPVIFQFKEGEQILGTADFTHVISQYVVVKSSGTGPAPDIRTFTLTVNNLNLEANAIEIRALTRLRK